ncbi:MAG: hypothetical protein KJO07_02610 [Deltaproteobacteria bacterium]|nr:hypothetical protein [Deltaproteobacteria bacterium]
MKRLAIAAIVAFPAAASAHPGHEHFGATNHTFGEWAMLGAVAVAGLCAAMWLRRRRED